jgi:hypothetical protein
VQPCNVSTKKLDDGQADRVGTSRGSRREHAVRSIVAWWGAQQFESFRVVEYPDDDEVRETLNISESYAEFRQYFENAFRVVFCANPLGISRVSLYELLTYPMGCGVNKVTHPPGLATATV